MNDVKDYATALIQFSETVGKYVPGFQKNLIQEIATELRNVGKKKSWDYSLSRFVFPDKTFKECDIGKTKPTTADGFKITISIKLNGLINKSDDDDPIEHLDVNLVIESSLADKSAGPSCAWHLDSHPPKDKTAKTTSSDGAFAHPRYHWQFGGKKIWEIADNSFYGNHLLLETPRLPHPPLDIILAVDFVLANFYGHVWQQLKDDDEYIKYIKIAQEIYWRPYFNSINSYWTTPALDGIASRLLPCLPPKKPPVIGKKPR